MKDIGTRDIIIGIAAIFIFCGGLYLGGTITAAHAESKRDLAIANAVSMAVDAVPPSTLSCADNEIIKAIHGLAERDIHIKGYNLKLEIESKRIKQ